MAQNITIEMALWIAKYGSERLQLLAENGYPIMRQYVTERAKIDYPEFTPDIDRWAAWTELEDGDPSPTVEQIALARKYGGRAVLLNHNTRGCGVYGRVAVVITNSPLGVPLVETAQRGSHDTEHHD